jgi:hypothetical protein
VEHEHAVGGVVGDRGARPIKVEQWLSDDGLIESIYVDDELVFVADRNPKYKIDLNKLSPNTGDGRSLPCVMCPAVTPDADYCCGLPYCMNCLPIHDCEMDDEGSEDGI